MEISAIRLRKLGFFTLVEAEVDGAFIELIREHSEGAFSHIVEESGMRKSVEKFRSESKS